MSWMNGYISNEKYMSRWCNKMLEEYYYIDILRERLRYHNLPS